MDPKFQTSFIPKQTSGVNQNFHQSSGGLSFIMLIAFIVTVITLLTSLGVYFYERQLQSSIVSLNDQIAKVNENLSGGFLDELKRLSNRIETSKLILGDHLSLSDFFLFLEKNTMRALYFKEFQYSLDASRNILIKMRGQAQSFNAVALQSDIFSKTPSIKSPIFSDLSLDNNGNVTFSFSGRVDPSLVLYKNSFTESSFSQ